MTDDEIHRIAGLLGDVVEKRLTGVATNADLAEIRAEMAKKADIAVIHTRFDRLELKINERFDDLDVRVSGLERR